MSPNNVLAWTRPQQLALVLSVVSCASLGFVLSPALIGTHSVCTAEESYGDWLLCELGETWPKQFGSPRPEGEK
jgi:hypothetical protein